MHAYKRSDRLGELILAEVSDMLTRGLKDPRIGFVTFTRAEMSEDLRYVKLFVSVLGSEQEKTRTLQGLASATGYIRRHLGRALHLRYTPEITFMIDSSVEHGAKIAQLLHQIHGDPTTY